mgnify:CR=1 FL=1
MKLTNLRRHRDAMALTRGVLSENPVLLCGLALPIAIMGTTSLRSGVALSLAMFCSMVPAMWVACVFSPQIPKMARMPACVVTAMAALQVAALFIRYISPSPLYVRRIATALFWIPCGGVSLRLFPLGRPAD